jgi:hypothetical protein
VSLLPGPEQSVQLNPQVKVTALHCVDQQQPSSRVLALAAVAAEPGAGPTTGAAPDLRVAHFEDSLQRGPELRGEIEGGHRNNQGQSLWGPALRPSQVCPRWHRCLLLRPRGTPAVPQGNGQGGREDPQENR